MIKITLEFETVKAAREALALLIFTDIEKAAAPQVESAGHPYVSPALDGGVRTPAAAAAPTEKRKPGRPRKEAPLLDFIKNAPSKMPAPVEAVRKLPNQPVQAIPASTPEEPVIVADASVVRAVLREVFNTQGNEAATALLKQFGVARIAELKPEQYVAFAKAGVKAQAPAAAAPVVEPVQATAEAAQAALETVFTGKGLPAAQELLSHFGVQRLRDLAPEQRAAFILAAGAV